MEIVLIYPTVLSWVRVVQLVPRFVTGWTVWESNSDGDEIFKPIQTGPGVPPKPPIQRVLSHSQG